MVEYINTPLFGIALTLIVFSVSNFIYNKFKNPILNPIAISIIVIISFLKFTGIDVGIYQKGGSIISFFLGPATVALAIPIYRRLNLLKDNIVPILISVFIGSLVGIISIVILSKVLLVDDLILLSLIPKSTTSAIAIDISKEVGGSPALTIVFVMATGILGNMIGPSILKIFNINNKKAKGLALGSASHVVGTEKAIELGETEGAISSIAISVAGIITVFLAPLIVKIIM